MFKINELVIATAGKLVFGPKDQLLRGIAIDSRAIRRREAFLAIKGSKFDGHDFIPAALKKGASCIIAQAPVACRLPASVSLILVKDTLRALGDLARFQRKKFDIPVIAVTGSNGKTTTKEMIAWVLSERYNVLKNTGTQNNHIGLPLTLLGLNSRHDCAVLEIGTNHFGEVKYLADIACANIAVITNIGSAHLQYFRNPQGVFKEKISLLESLQEPEIALLNADDGLLAGVLRKQINRPITFGFGIKERSDFHAREIKINRRGINFRINSDRSALRQKFRLDTLGYHNIYNALAAAAVGRILGLGYARIISRLSTFSFPQGRFKEIVFRKIRFLDDSYNANPASLKAALEALSSLKTRGRKILVMGDMLELGKQQGLYHKELGRYAARICDAFISVGKLSAQAALSARACGLDSRNIFSCESSAEARRILFERISVKAEDLVLVKGSRLMHMEEVMK